MSPAADSRCHAVWMSGSFGANSSPTNATPPSAEAAMCSRCARRRCGCCCARRRKSTCAAGGDRGSGHEKMRVKQEFRVVDCARSRKCTCETEAISHDFAARRGQTCFRQKLRAATDRADSAAQRRVCPHPARLRLCNANPRAHSVTTPSALTTAKGCQGVSSSDRAPKKPELVFSFWFS